MQSHVRVLAILNIVFGFIGILIGLTIFLFLGGIAGVIGMTDSSDSSWLAIPIVGGVGAFILLLSALFSLPSIIGGLGLLKYRPWARILLIVLSILDLFHFPFGTALGVYGLWVLFSPEVTAIFQSREHYV